ncbi:MAG TPA: hypothetical protein VHL34_04725 [Rhizomicrobium sp.]|nr:hypothetical protein [Rhizomicrobium sp.]
MSSATLVPQQARPHRGLPALDTGGRAIAFFEFWPQWAFYTPMVLYWVYLSIRHGGATLPTVSNPSFPFGGWIGESKDAVLRQAGPFSRTLIAPFISFVRGDDPSVSAAGAIRQLRNAGLRFPVVAKPDMGCRGVGVRRVRNENDLVQYIAGFPAGERIILQALVDHEAEAGVFYVRRPGEARGQIISLTLKYFPYVYGDGHSTLAELIARDRRAGPLKHLYLARHVHRCNDVLADGQPYRIAFAGSHSRGTIFRDGNAFITDAMTEAFDAVAKDIDGFFFGRFDVRFTTLDDLRMGRGFTILECNGAGAEATHIWDRRTTLREAYRTLIQQYALLWEIGAENARRGAAPARFRDLFRAWRNEVRLWAKYPPTE